MTASLIAQTHFTLVLQTLILAAVESGGFLLCHRGRWADAARPVAVGGIVALLCWSQPLWDQFAGEGNLGAVISGSDAPDGVGLGLGARIVAGAVLVPRSWHVGSMGSFEVPGDAAEATATVVALVLCALVIAAGAFSAWRTGRTAVGALAAMGGVALFAAVLAAAQIPPSAFGLLTQNYFWLWPSAVFVAIGITACLASALVTGWTLVRRVVRSPVVAGSLLAACVVVATIGCREVSHFGNVTSELSAGSRLGPTLLDELGDSLDELDVEGPLTVDFRRATWGTYFGYTILAELQRAGIEFRFPPDDRNLERFGRERCDDGGAVGRIVLTDAGNGLRVRRDEVVLAHVDGLSDRDREKLAVLDQAFAGWLHAGTIGVDADGLGEITGRDVPGLAEILASPTAPVEGLAMELNGWRESDLVRVPDELDDDFDRWVRLSLRSNLEVVAVLLAPPEDFLVTESPPMSHTFCPT